MAVFHQHCIACQNLGYWYKWLGASLCNPSFLKKFGEEMTLV